MTTTSTLSMPEDTAQRALYEELARGEHSTGPNGTVVFVVFTDQLDLRRGDLYVALGLAKYLNRLGWGVRLLPGPQWYEPLEGPADVAIVMIESFVPGLLPPHVATVAWCRNWTSAWAALPYLDEFDAIWSSSAESAAVLSKAAGAAVEVVPIAADAELFHPAAGQRDIPVLSTANFWGEERSLAGALGAVSRRHEVVWVGGGSTTEDTGDVVFPGNASYFAVPELYRRSSLVVDDVIPPAREFANHNSRLFESLSAGALPITNEARGLEELGLADVPVYSGPDDLVATVDGLLADPEGTAALQRRLAEVVGARHTFAHRAGQVDGILRALVASTSTRSSRSPLIGWIARERVRLNAFHEQLVAEQARTAELEARAAAEPSTRAVVSAAARRLVQLPARIVRRLARRTGN